MRPEEEFRRALDYIVNRAGDNELDVLRAALERRLRGRPPQGPADLDFRNMAASMTEDLGARFAMPAQDQIKEMTRSLVENIIRTHEPNIPQADLDALLDRYVPEPGRSSHPGREANLPADVLLTMVRQFVAYGSGAMPAEEERSLKREMPDWPKRYWEMFSAETQTLIRRRLEGEIEAAELERALAERSSGGSRRR